MTNIKVVKKDNRIEPFYESKIRTSLENVSDECMNCLNQSDINLIINSVIKELAPFPNCCISSVKIKALVYIKLKELGYDALANFYYDVKE